MFEERENKHPSFFFGFQVVATSSTISVYGGVTTS